MSLTTGPVSALYRPRMIPRWAACLLGALVCYLLALWIAPMLPGSIGGVIQALLYIGAIVLAIAGVILLILWFTGRGTRV